MPDGTLNPLTSLGAFANDAQTTKKASTADTCCGGPAPAGTNACCVRDAEVKVDGRRWMRLRLSAPGPSEEDGVLRIAFSQMWARSPQGKITTRECGPRLRTWLRSWNDEREPGR